MGKPEERLAENQSLFRAINELIETTASAMGVDEHRYEFLCECADTQCHILLPLTVWEYELVRADPTQFLLAPNHELPEIEVVVAHEGRYQVVRKLDDAGEYAAARDPRSL